MSNTTPAPQSLLIDRLRAAVQEFNLFLPTLNAREQEYAVLSHERYIPVAPEAEIDEKAWTAASREDVLEKLKDVKTRHEANERNVITLDKLLGSRRRHTEEKKSPSKAGDAEQQAVKEEMRRLTVDSVAKHGRR